MQRAVTAAAAPAIQHRQPAGAQLRVLAAAGGAPLQALQVGLANKYEYVAKISKIHIYINRSGSLR